MTATTNLPKTLNLSFWEHQHLFANIDFCIAGGGIVGLHTALFLKKAHPNAKILVLEKALIGAAASSKNAGFACFGSVSEIMDDLRTTNFETALELIKMRWDGLQLLIETHGKEAVGFKATGGYELFTADDANLFDACSDFIPELNKNLGFIGSNVYELPASMPYSFRKVTNSILTRFEGQVETHRMYFNLEQSVRSAGIQVIRGFEVESFTDLGHCTDILLANSGISFKAGKLLITTNGFAAKLLPKAEVKPARAQVLVTEPIPNFDLLGTFHYDKGYYYFRNCGNRLLIGGGRNLNFNAEETDNQTITDEIQQAIEELMYSVILREKVKIEYRWAGTMGLGTTKYPIIEQVSTNVFCGVRMGGMGVAIGALVAQKLAQLTNS